MHPQKVGVEQENANILKRNCVGREGRLEEVGERRRKRGREVMEERGRGGGHNTTKNKESLTAIQEVYPDFVALALMEVSCSRVH